VKKYFTVSKVCVIFATETKRQEHEENPQYVSWLFTSGAANFSKTCLKEIVAAGHEDIVEMINKEKDKKAQARKLKREKALKTEKFNELIKQGNWEEAEKYI